MIVNRNDKEAVTKYLNEHLVYRETFNELYDHVLSTLENYPEAEPFELAFQNIITQQFGGVGGLKKIEQQYRKQTLNHMQTRYIGHILRLIISPSIVLVGITAAAAWLLFNWLSFNKSLYFPVFLVLLTVPSIINAVRYFKAGYIFGSTKRSAGDDGFRLLKYAPGIIVATMIFYHGWILNETSTQWFNTITPTAATTVFVAYLFHMVAYYKMYVDEFKFTFSR